MSNTFAVRLDFGEVQPGTQSMLTLTRLMATAGVALVACGAAGPATYSIAKDQARIPYGEVLDIRAGEYDARIKSSDTAPWSTPIGDPARLMFALDHIAMPKLGPPSLGAGFRPPPPPGPGSMLAGPPFPPIGLDRPSCDESIDRHAAVAGYIHSKLRLQGTQNEAWQKIEQAAQPTIEKLREICASLPAEAGLPPSFPGMIGTLERQLTAHAQFLHAIAGPVQALYDTLSPQQRTVIDHPPRP